MDDIARGVAVAGAAVVGGGAGGRGVASIVGVTARVGGPLLGGPGDRAVTPLSPQPTARSRRPGTATASSATTPARRARLLVLITIPLCRCLAAFVGKHPYRVYRCRERDPGSRRASQPRLSRAHDGSPRPPTASGRGDESCQAMLTRSFSPCRRSGQAARGSEPRLPRPVLAVT